jgi:hypothetical protein
MTERETDIFEALGRIEQKLDDHLDHHATSGAWARWAVTSIVAIFAIWASAAFAGSLGGL